MKKSMTFLFIVIFAVILVYLSLLHYRGKNMGRGIAHKQRDVSYAPVISERTPSPVKDAQARIPRGELADFGQLLLEESLLPKGEPVILGSPPKFGNVVTIPNDAKGYTYGLSPDGRYSVFYSVHRTESPDPNDWAPEEKVILWDVSTGENRILMENDASSTSIAPMAWHPDSRRLVFMRSEDLGPGSGRFDRRMSYMIRIFNVDSGKSEMTAKCPVEYPQIIGVGQDSVIVWSQNQRLDMYEVSLHNGTAKDLGAFPFSRDGGTYSYGSFYFDPDSRELHLVRLTYEDGKRSASHSHTMKVSLDNLSAGLEMGVDLTKFGPGCRVVWNRGGNAMAVSSFEKGLYVCDTNGKMLKHFEGEQIDVKSFVGDNILFTAPPSDRRMILTSEIPRRAMQVPYIISLKE